MKIPEFQPKNINQEFQNDTVTFSENLHAVGEEIKKLKSEVARYESEKNDPTKSKEERVQLHAKWLLAKIKLIEEEMGREMFLQRPKEGGGRSETQDSSMDMDLDFTRPGALPSMPGVEVKESVIDSVEDRRKQLKETIAGFDKMLNERKNQPDIIKIIMGRKKEMEAELSLLEQNSTAPAPTIKAANESDFGQSSNDFDDARLERELSNTADGRAVIKNSLYESRKAAYN